MRRALQGCRAVITRPAAQAEELSTLLQGAGADVRSRPLVRLVSPADGGRQLELALSQLDSYDWVVFTSANAVRACSGPIPAGSRRWPRIACVGQATARAARAAGLEVALIPEHFTGDALAQALAMHAEVAGARVLWPRASGAREALKKGLEASGAQVDAVEAYRTIQDEEAGRALREELAGTPADIVVFTSPSAVRAFSASGTGYRGPVAVIGRVTGESAREAGLRVVVQPVEQSLERLVQALGSWFEEQHGRSGEIS